VGADICERACLLLRLDRERRGEHAASQGADERPSIQRILDGTSLGLLIALQTLTPEALSLIAS